MTSESFAKQFYSWYVPLAQRSSTSPASTIALKEHGADLSPELAAALREDADAQARIPGMIVGIEFDPFLGGQDVCERYEVGPAHEDARGSTVDVYGVCSGRRSVRPDVVAVVARSGGGWRFVNFRYPAQQTDLLQQLRQAREDRSDTARGS